MKLDIVKVGYLETNCYIISKNNKVLIIDPGSDHKKIINKIEDKKVVGVLITHSHSDHIGALEQIKEYYNVDVYDKHNLSEGLNSIDEFEFTVRYNPGHTSDSISFIFNELDAMFTGDFLFKMCVGRTDIGGNNKDMIKSINELVNSNLDENLLIYPGHEDSSTLRFEKNNNPYLRGDIDF